jgi:uncharacterized metal-binding protein YceD (DUF177 family)
MTNDFTHILTVAEIGQNRDVSLKASEADRLAIAQRLKLLDVQSFSMDAKLTAIAGGVKLVGTVKAQVVQPCAATDLPVPARIDEPFELHFLRNLDQDISSDDDEIEIEISGEDCEKLPLENERIDVADAAVQTLSLALDPFPRHPNADSILAEKGVLSEGQAGPFAALAALKK